jgi:hypothetical protein
MNRNTSFGTIVYIIIGLVVASNRGYLSDLTTISNLLSAVIAVLLWPLLLFGISLHLAL